MVKYGVYIQYDNGSRGLKIANLDTLSEAEQRVDFNKGLSLKEHKVDFFSFSYELGELTSKLEELNIIR